MLCFAVLFQFFFSPELFSTNYTLEFFSKQVELHNIGMVCSGIYILSLLSEWAKVVVCL